jgi:hypothetical protein
MYHALCHGHTCTDHDLTRFFLIICRPQLASGLVLRVWLRDSRSNKTISDRVAMWEQTDAGLGGTSSPVGTISALQNGARRSPLIRGRL